MDPRPLPPVSLRPFFLTLFPSHVFRATQLLLIRWFWSSDGEAGAQTSSLSSQLSQLPPGQPRSSAHRSPNPTWPTQTLLSWASLWLVLYPASTPGLPTPSAPFGPRTVPHICTAPLLSGAVPSPRNALPHQANLYSFSLNSMWVITLCVNLVEPWGTQIFH